MENLLPNMKKKKIEASVEELLQVWTQWVRIFPKADPWEQYLKKLIFLSRMIIKS